DLAFASPHELRHALVFLEGEIDTVPLGLPVRRVHVMEGMWPIIALGTGQPWQMLDVHARQSLPRQGQILFDSQQVDRRSGGRGAKGLATDLPAEGVVLEVEKTSGPLNIG